MCLSSLSGRIKFTRLLCASGSTGLERRDQGNGWNGSFPDSTLLLWKRGSTL
jgi:hypothetical protein